MNAFHKFQNLFHQFSDKNNASFVSLGSNKRGGVTETSSDLEGFLGGTCDVNKLRESVT